MVHTQNINQLGRMAPDRFGWNTKMIELF
jgi:hypothetical protein